MTRFRVTVDVFLDAETEQAAIDKVGGHIALCGDLDYSTNDAGPSDPDEEP